MWLVKRPTSLIRRDSWKLYVWLVFLTTSSLRLLMRMKEGFLNSRERHFPPLSANALPLLFLHIMDAKRKLSGTRLKKQKKQLLFHLVLVLFGFHDVLRKRVDSFRKHFCTIRQWFKNCNENKYLNRRKFRGWPKLSFSREFNFADQCCSLNFAGIYFPGSSNLERKFQKNFRFFSYQTEGLNHK